MINVDCLLEGLMVGLLFFVRKHLTHIISFCCQDDDGCIIGIKLGMPNLNTLILGAIFHVVLLLKAILTC